MLVYIKDTHKFGIITNITDTNITVGLKYYKPYEVIILGFVAIKATGKNTLLKRIWNDLKSQGISLNNEWTDNGRYHYYSPFRDYWCMNEVIDAGYFTASEDEILNAINQQQSTLQENIPPEEAINIAKRNINKQNLIKNENRLQEQNSSVSGGSRPATARSLYTGDQITIARRHARNRAAIG